MLNDIISPMGCNNPMDIREEGMHGGPVVAPISSMLYQMMVVLGGLGVDTECLLGASCVTD